VLTTEDSIRETEAESFYEMRLAGVTAVIMSNPDVRGVTADAVAETKLMVLASARVLDPDLERVVGDDRRFIGLCLSLCSREAVPVAEVDFSVVTSKDSIAAIAIASNKRDRDKQERER
jgi:cytosine/adenosine deaminase-related metal-dependent hydrolase